MLKLTARIIAVLIALAWITIVRAGTAVESIGITVSDMDRAVAFYSEVLSFEPVADQEVTGEEHERVLGVFGLRLRTVRMRLGEELIELMQFLAPSGRPMPADTRSNDGWFQHIAIIVSDMDQAYAHLRRHRIQHASSGPQTLPHWNPAAGGISAFYFRDPDGNHLEILEFPAGKGDERWQRRDGRLFLGIDHTAIVVTDTEASLRFYRDVLGMQVVGQSENYGPEQERLNNVFGARLAITTLRGEAGIGVELLEYLAPRTGRPMPPDTQANDLWHWQINVARDEPLPVASLHRAARVVSSAASPSPPGDRAAMLMVRDPDGHASLLRTPTKENASAAGRRADANGEDVSAAGRRADANVRY